MPVAFDGISVNLVFHASRQISTQMEILTINRQIFAWLCICSLTKDSSQKIKFLRILFSVCISLIQILAVGASVAFLYRNLSIDVTNSTYGLLEITAIGSAAYTIISAYFLRNNIDGIFINLQEIYDSEFSIQCIEI